MLSFVIPLYKLIDEYYNLINGVSLSIGGFAFIELVSLKSYVEDSFLKKLAFLFTITWYAYLLVTKIMNKKLEKENKEIENENIRLRNEIEKELLKKIKKDDINTLINELEEKQRNLYNEKH